MILKRFLSLFLCTVLLLSNLAVFCYAADLTAADGTYVGFARTSSNFTDVPEDAFYSNAVLWAVENNITTGTSATTFAPDDICTRGQVVTFLWRAAGRPAPEKADTKFTDLADGAFYYDAVLWAVENGITTGTSATTFDPDANCNRGQIVTFLYRFMGGTASGSKNTFEDLEDGAFYYDAVLWAAENGITTGTSSTTFSPEDNCTRGQIVTFLYRAYTNRAHDYQTQTVEATCTEDGYTMDVCTICGDTINSQIIPMLGHDVQETVTMQPTCDAAGIKTVTCSRCDYFELAKIAQLTHSYRETRVEATCTEDGYAMDVCTICGDTINSQVIPMLDHDTKETVTKQPTCNASGVKTTACSRCDYTKTEDIAKLDHIYSETIVAATCSKEGSVTKTCSACGDTSVTTIEKLPHKWTDKVVLEATCSQEGSGVQVCSVCNATGDSYSIATTPHTTATRVIKEADCTTEGAEETYCTLCNTVTKTEVLPFAHNGVFVAEYYDGEWVEEQCIDCNAYTYTYKYTQEEAAEIMLSMVNELRASLGLNPLTLDSALCSNARSRAAALPNDFSHNGSSYSENICKGYATLQDQYNAWLNSPGHYANMTNPDMTTFGYGYYNTPGTMYMYACQTFYYF